MSGRACETAAVSFLAVANFILIAEKKQQTNLRGKRVDALLTGFQLDAGCSDNTVINCNNIEGNLPYGVYSENATVNATNNSWGDASGPSHSPGTGDNVSANVTYDPWLPMKFQYCDECVGAPPSPPGVPTANHWGIVAMIALFAALLVWTVRRRQLAS